MLNNLFQLSLLFDKLEQNILKMFSNIVLQGGAINRQAALRCLRQPGPANRPRATGGPGRPSRPVRYGWSVRGARSAWAAVPVHHRGGASGGVFGEWQGGGGGRNDAENSRIFLNFLNFSSLQVPVKFILNII